MHRITNYDVNKNKCGWMLSLLTSEKGYPLVEWGHTGVRYNSY